MRFARGDFPQNARGRATGRSAKYAHPAAVKLRSLRGLCWRRFTVAVGPTRSKRLSAMRKC